MGLKGSFRSLKSYVLAPGTEHLHLRIHRYFGLDTRRSVVIDNTTEQRERRRPIERPRVSMACRKANSGHIC